MSTTNPLMRYGAVSQFLHWTIAALVIVQLVMGKAGFIDAEHSRTAAFMWHSSLGIIVLALALVRILWILVKRPPAFPATLSRLGRISARAVHVSLYALLIALPMSGWWAASSEGATVSFFNVATIPGWQITGASPARSEAQPQTQAEPQGNGPEQEDLAEEIHALLGDALLVLVIVHVLAALKHQFVDRDQLIQRMLPARRSHPKTGAAPPTNP
jgi:cytochrome b561